MVMKRPATFEDYQELVNQAIIEVEELRAAVEFDEEFMEDALNFVGILEQDLNNLLNSMKDGSYQYADEDLPYMNLVKEQNKLILPFKGLLNLINSTHRQGLQTEQE